MLYLKQRNNLVYIDFTKKDYCDFVYKHGKRNVNKITLIINEIEPTCLYWLAKIADMEKYKNIKFIIATATYKRLYLNFIKRVLKEWPQLNMRAKIQGGYYSLSHANLYYSFYKDNYYTNIDKRIMELGGYTKSNIDEYVYCDMFYKNGAAIYGPSCIYKDRNSKWDFLLKLAISITGSITRPVNKEESKILYDKYLQYKLRMFDEIEGQYGKLPDGRVVKLSGLFVSPPMNNVIGHIDTVEIYRGASSSCEVQYMDN